VGRPRSSPFVVTIAAAATLVAACGGGPSKSQALEQIQASVKEDGSCTLPIAVLSQLKVQPITRAMCVPLQGAEKARACVDALVAAGITQPMDPSYMVTWPDEVTGVSLTDVSAYERKARNLLFGTCVAMSPALRVGLIPCAQARAEKVTRVTVKDERHADVHYDRELALRPSLAAIDAACGEVTRPPAGAIASFEKDAAGTWKIKVPERATP